MATPGWTEKKRSSAPMRRGSVPQKIYWEGINLNKISKKIVSLVTMATFAATLVPAAAFAADPADITVDQIAAKQLNVTFHEALSDVAINLSDADGAVTADVKGAGDSSDLGETNALLGTAGNDVNSADAVKIVGLDAGNYTLQIISDGTEVYTESLYVADETSTGNSRVLLNDENGNAVSEAKVGDKATVKLEVRDTNNEVSTLPLNPNNNEYVLVWAEDASGNLVNDVTFTTEAGDEALITSLAGTIYNDSLVAISATANTAAYVAVENGATITANFNTAGTYTICSAVATVGPSVDNDKIENTGVVFVGKELKSSTVKVTANPVNVVTEAVDFAGNDGTFAQNGVNWTYTLNDDVVPNDTKTYTVTGHAYSNEAAGTPAVGEKIYINCNQNGHGITLVGVDNGYVTTDKNGMFTFKFILNETGSYNIVYQESKGDIKGTLTVTQDNVAPVHIKTVTNNGLALAGTDINYAADVYAGASVQNPVYLTDAVTFNIIDAFGHEAEGNAVLANEEAAFLGPDHGDYVRIVSAPKATDEHPASTLEADDLILAWDGSAYTLAYVGDERATDLVPGDYVVNVSLNNGGKNVAVAKFTLAEFGTVQSIDLEMNAVAIDGEGDINGNAINAVDDQVALGQRVTVNPVYVDENGLRVDAPVANMSLGVNGDAVARVNTTGTQFDTYANVPANESLIGTTITVKAYDEIAGKYVEKELTVVKNYLAETLAFDQAEGEVGRDNVVAVSVVDEDGNVSKVNGTMTAYIASQSDETASIDLDVDNTVSNGKGKLFLESDKEGTVDVVVAVKADNGEIYGATLTYTFGEVDEYTGRTVVMTIGSSDYLINNAVVEGDAAPYVDDAWRTMVPFRVLGEAFGAEVDWNQEAQSVTYTVGDTEIVMTIGETTYTLNGEEQTMDTAPVLSGDRTYVPVRFVAEDLGFEVTPLYNAENGTTASVVFQK